MFVTDPGWCSIRSYELSISIRFSSRHTYLRAYCTCNDFVSFFFAYYMHQYIDNYWYVLTIPSKRSSNHQHQRWGPPCSFAVPIRKEKNRINNHFRVCDAVRVSEWVSLQDYAKMCDFLLLLQLQELLLLFLYVSLIWTTHSCVATIVNVQYNSDRFWHLSYF